MARENGIVIYSMYNEGKFLKDLLESWRIKLINTWLEKNVNINKLDDIVKKYNNTYHSTIKMKSFDVNSSKYIYSSKELSDKDPVPNWSGEVFMISSGKVKNTGPWTYVTSDPKVKKLFENFTKRNFKKQNKKI